MTDLKREWGGMTPRGSPSNPACTDFATTFAGSPNRSVVACNTNDDERIAVAQDAADRRPVGDEARPSRVSRP